MALPGPSLGRGAGSMTRGYAAYDDGSAPSSSCENSRKTQQKGKTKTTEGSDQNALAASRPEKGPQKSTRRIPKTRGAQNGTPRKTPRSRTHGQKGRTSKCGGTKKRNKDKQNKCVWGCALLLPELSLLKKRRKKDDDVGERTKGRTKTTKKHQT